MKLKKKRKFWAQSYFPDWKSETLDIKSTIMPGNNVFTKGILKNLQGSTPAQQKFILIKFLR